MAPWLARIRQRIVVRRVRTTPVDWRVTVKRRLSVAIIALTCWAASIEARLVYLQVAHHDEYAKLASLQQTGKQTLLPRRGDIYDRNGHRLATSADGEYVRADPANLIEPAAAVTALCRILSCDQAERTDLQARFSKKDRHYERVKRWLTAEQSASIAALNLTGIYIEREPKRYYPKDSLAANVLGWSGNGENGLGGIEAAFNSFVGGQAGQAVFYTDAHRERFNLSEQPPTPGMNIELTIDEYIQHIAERELAAAVREHQALGGTVAVMQPRTGEILAMASVPSFDPNKFSMADRENSRNLAVQYSYEPGSTFKIVTAAAAIEEHVLPLDAIINTSPGIIRIGKDIIDEYEHHNYGSLSFTDVIVKSSNVGAVKIGLQVGTERLARYVERFGFGHKVSRDFPAEATGFFKAPTTDRALASNSMGYQLSVTPLQSAAAFSAVANGGEYVEPHIVRAIERNGKREQVRPKVVRRSIKPETAAILTTIMEQVVERGTAKSAQIPGFTIAGKTGTASKVINGHYAENKNNTSFVGFVPSRNPAITIVVMIDEPHVGGRAGGAVAAPVFKRIAEQTLSYLGVSASINAPTPVLIAKRNDGGAAMVPTSAKLPAPPAVDRIATAAGTIPDLRGMSGRDASRVLTRLGLQPEVDGNGFVRTQDPLPGTPIEAGLICRLVLDRGSERRTPSSGAP
jgi:cell division protein FtsI/penicillin-binding protein 2